MQEISSLNEALKSKLKEQTRTAETLKLELDSETEKSRSQAMETQASMQAKIQELEVFFRPAFRKFIICRVRYNHPELSRYKLKRWMFWNSPHFVCICWKSTNLEFILPHRYHTPVKNGFHDIEVRGKTRMAERWNCCHENSSLKTLNFS